MQRIASLVTVEPQTKAILPKWTGKILLID
jgi:hypothetical protein